MTYREALQFLEDRPRAGKPTLERIRALLDALGNPQRNCRYIHIAGTNGKGSVCAMLDSILRAAGYRVGRFTSPSIRSFNERIAIDGSRITDDELVALVEELQPTLSVLDLPFNSFELITAVAFSYFSKRNADVVLLEVGLGGRFDPTNCIDSSLLSVITEIDFDHTQLLGNTIQGIAAEKAGIIKEGGRVLYGGKDNSAIRTIAGIAKLRHANLYTVDRSRLHVKQDGLAGCVFDFDALKDLTLPLLGSYQKQNAATVLTAIELLEELGISVSEAALREGLARVRWQARFELLREKDPVLLFDGAHNPQGVKLAVRSMQTYFPEQKVNILSGVMSDKDSDGMIEAMKPIVEHLFAVAPDGTSRSLNAADYAALARSHKLSASAYENVSDALRAAIEDSRKKSCPLLCLGSLYLYAPLITALEQLED